jgi:hypothetical protein
MGKRGKKSISKKTKEPRQRGRQQPSQTSTAKKLLKYLTSTTAIVSFLIGVVGFLFVVYPRISVHPGESLDPYNPFATPFLIKNDGYLPVRDVHYSITPRNIKFIVPGGEATLMGESDNVFIESSVTAKIPLLKSNRSTTIFVPPPTEKMVVTSADILINLTYQSYLVPYAFSEKHRFISTVKKTGEYVWLEDYSQK